MAASVAHSVERNLTGKVALISGSSTGIGAAIARELSRRGASIIINYPFPSEEASARAVLESLDSSSQSFIVEADLSTLEGPKELANATAKRFGRVDILVNNAGISSICSISEASDLEILQTWDRAVNLNGRGTLLLTRAILPILNPSGSRIINIGSSTSRDPDPDMTIYAGTKGMIETFTRCWARDFPRKYGCTVNTIAPGPVATEGLLAAPAEFLGMLQAKSERVPAGTRFALPEEIAWTVAALCDENARWLNGLYMLVTGGGTLC